MTKLFSEFTIKNYTIKNRIVMPPMVCFGWTDDSGKITDDHLIHYKAIAESGIGLIIVEAHCIRKDGRLANSQPGIWSDEQIENLSKIAEVCHKHGAVVLVQIHHAGYKTPKTIADPAVAPSDYVDDNINARALTLEEIKSLQNDFVKAALRAKKAGFDGIELHGAHSYLINQFMSPISNKRQDKYGGDLFNRARFALEIIENIKYKAGNEFIIGYRMGGNEPTLKDGIAIAELLEKSGIDILHVSAGIGGGVLPQPPKDFPYNWIVYMGTEIKKHMKIPVIVVNDIRTPERAKYLVDSGMADFVAIGRGQLADHQWVKHAIENQSIIECQKCKKCSWFINGKNCPRYNLNQLKSSSS